MNKWKKKSKSLSLNVFRWVIIVGICYVILGPVLGIISSSFFSDADSFNPMVYLIPQEPTLERYEMAAKYLKKKAKLAAKDKAKLIADMEAEMREAAATLDFERAAQLRDMIFELKSED